MPKRKVAALEKIEVDYPNLQQKIRRDPHSYHTEFQRQAEAYHSLRDVFKSEPSTASAAQIQSFHDLIDFIAHVVNLYPNDVRDFPDDLSNILTLHHRILPAELREKIVGSLALLRKHGLIDSTNLIQVLLHVLVSSPSKSLRALLINKIVSDLRNSNRKSTNHPLNKTVVRVLYNILNSDRTSSQGIWAVRITREMWKRQVWTTAQPVDLTREATLSDNEKVVTAAVRFFLGADQDRDDAQDDVSGDEDAPDLKKMQHISKINKKAKKKERAYRAAVEKVRKADKKKNQPGVTLNFSALQLLHDPPGFAEALFEKHLRNTKSKFSLESRLLILQLVTRVVGLHKAVLLPLFSWFTKFLTPRQQSVTSFLASLAQSIHDQVPPDAVEPLVLRIAQEFISEGQGAEVAAAGLNAVREICRRQPLCMNEALLQDLVQYRKSKDKGVQMAARGLLSLYRVVGAELLEKKDRGKDASMGLRSGEMRQRKFGEQDDGIIEGLDLLEQWKEEEKKRKRAADGMLKIDDSDGGHDGEDEEYHSSDWEVESVGSSDSGGWINVSDSEDDEPTAKRQKKDAESAEPEADDEDKENDQAERLAFSKLATTTILTPADLAKLKELRMDSSVDKAMGTKRRRQKELETRHTDDGLTAEQIELPATLRKTTKEERIALAKEGKPNREEHKSTQAIRKSKKEAEGKSTTNKEKSKKKNLMMTMGKARQKQKRSLVQTRKVLKAHVERSKRGGRRGNH